MTDGTWTMLGRSLILTFAALAMGVGALAAGADPSEKAAGSALQEAYQAYSRGDLERSAAHFERAIIEADRTTDVGQKIDARLGAGAAYQSMGHYVLANRALLQAEQLAIVAELPARVIAAKNSRGVLLTLMRNPDAALPLLVEARDLALKANHSSAAAQALNNLGNLLAAHGATLDVSRHAKALGPDADAGKAFDRAIELAVKADDRALIARCAVNAALHAIQEGRADRARVLDEQASETAASMPDSHDKVLVFIALGRNEIQLAAMAKTNEASHRALAGKTMAQATRVAEGLDDRRGLSYALGLTAQLAEVEGRLDDALQHSRRAAFLAQQIGANEALYRWQWHTGRLLAARATASAAQPDEAGQLLDQAVRAYDLAAATLRKNEFRFDLALGYGNRGAASSFRAAVGDLYYEHADLLLRRLQRGNGKQDEQVVQDQLRLAREAIESLKTAELSDYFRSACVAEMEKKRRDIDAIIDPTTAVVYLIPLADRLEILLSLSNGRMRRQTVKVSSDALLTQVRSLRTGLEDRLAYDFVPPARKLYDWIIRPIEGVLQQEKIDSLVFVPDGHLRSVPMAALLDGKAFLITRYAVVVAPGLRLVDPRHSPRGKLEVLATGLTEARFGFTALPNVKAELEQVQQIFGTNATRLIDKQFVSDTIEREVQRKPYGIVHIASHGQFSSDPSQTFLLTYDGKLTLDQLEGAIRPAQFRGEGTQDIELLTLSACQTAAGDDRAALGLAGIAVKAGARCAVATLWSVDDETSARLISRFYQELHDHPTLSKAKALQRAQVQVLDEIEQHPFFWSPYLIIGNWR